MKETQLHCDNHPERAAVHNLGHDDMDGGQMVYFKVTKRLCDECYRTYSRKHILIERT